MRTKLLEGQESFEVPLLGCKAWFLGDLRLKKTTMAKVVEYLKHHEEHEPSNIQTPLQGENLQDSGASRWDSSFVNVDRDLLFDLTVAASYLDIASLWILLSAKAALLTSNKSADKLRKEPLKALRSLFLARNSAW